MPKLTKENVENWGCKYDQRAKPIDKTVEEKMKRLLTTQRYLTKAQLVQIGMWKSTRAEKWYRRNVDKVVREITGFSFAAKTEQARIGALCALRGVSFPVASVILHFAFPARYPVLDFRALQSLGWPQPKSYTFEFWNKYCREIRRIGRHLNLPLRTVDKALWQYSNEQGKQRKSG